MFSIWNFYPSGNFTLQACLPWLEVQNFCQQPACSTSRLGWNGWHDTKRPSFLTYNAFPSVKGVVRCPRPILSSYYHVGTQSRCIPFPHRVASLGCVLVMAWSKFRILFWTLNFNGMRWSNDGRSHGHGRDCAGLRWTWNDGVLDVHLFFFFFFLVYWSVGLRRIAPTSGRSPRKIMLCRGLDARLVK